jgi:hypothetical protein
MVCLRMRQQQQQQLVLTPRRLVVWSQSGGGIYNEGTLTISDSTFTGNTAVGPLGPTRVAMCCPLTHIMHVRAFLCPATPSTHAGGAVSWPCMQRTYTSPWPGHAVDSGSDAVGVYVCVFCDSACVSVGALPAPLCRRRR